MTRDQSNPARLMIAALAALLALGATTGLKSKVGDFRYAHFDNDFFEREDPADGHHVSDHDPPVLTLSK